MTVQMGKKIHSKLEERWLFEKCAPKTVQSEELAHWHIGTLAHWHIGTLAHWHIGTLAHCCHDRFIWRTFAPTRSNQNADDSFDQSKRW
jgi:hypothetical protein